MLDHETTTILKTPEDVDDLIFRGENDWLLISDR